jgi:hypothetical protein
MTASTMEHSPLGEFEDELEGGHEGEEFFGSLARRAAQAVLGSLGGGSGGGSDGEFEDEFELEDEGEGEFEDEYELEGEWEGEGEFEDESEAMANPLRRVYPDAMMEHLGHAAAEAETEAEAEAMIGALVPLAAGLARKAAPHVAKSTPQLVRGLSTVTHTLRRNPATRQLVRVVPTIAAQTTQRLARQAAHGRPVTPRRAIRTLAQQTARVLSDPRARHHAVRRARALDRRYHHATRTGQWWTGAVPGASTAGVRALAPRPATAGGYVTGGGYAPARYQYGRPEYRYRYGTPARYRYGAPVEYRYGGPVEYRDGGPAGYRAPTRRRAPARREAPVRYGAPVQYRAPVRQAPAPARGYPRQRRLPAGLSIAWVPVPAWRGSQPPPGAYRY